jgi:hypothetical protein
MLRGAEVMLRGTEVMLRGAEVELGGSEGVLGGAEVVLGQLVTSEVVAIVFAATCVPRSVEDHKIQLGGAHAIAILHDIELHSDYSEPTGPSFYIENQLCVARV